MKAIPLSDTQQRFWLEWKIEPQSNAYNTALLYEISGNLNETALLSALNTYVNQCDAGCRTSFVEDELGVEQIIHDNIPCDLEWIDLSKSHLTRETVIESSLKQPFDLTHPPLFRFTLAKINDNQLLLILNFHHIIADAVSVRYFVPILSALYNHFAHHEEINLHENNLEDYIHHERRIKTTERIRNDLNYWGELLKNKELQIELPFDVSVCSKSRKASSYFSSFDTELTQAVKAYARKQATTPFIILSTVFGILLSRYSQKKQVTLSYPINIRPGAYKHNLGCLINHIPMVIDTDVSRFSDLVQRITEQRKASKIHQSCSLTDIILHLRQTQGLLLSSLLNVSITEAQFLPPPLQFKHLSIIPLQTPAYEIANDFALAYQISDTLLFRIDYLEACCSVDWVKRFFEHFKCLLKQFVVDEVESASPHYLLVDELDTLNRWESSPPSEQPKASVIELFEQQVKRTPEIIALNYRNESYTFLALNSRVNQFAREISLRYASVFHVPMKPGAIIGIHLSRGLDFVVSILAILKTRGAYLPLDPSYPDLRIQFMIKNSEIALLISDDLHPDICSDQIINPTNVSLEKYANEDLEQKPNLQDMAYLLYTSGSTGQPKGVMVQHSQLSNLITDFQHRLHPLPGHSWLSVTSPNFDIFGLELFLPLITGCSLHLLDADLLESGEKLAQFLMQQAFTFIQATPSLWSMLAAINWPGYSAQLTILTGGEALSYSLMQYLIKISCRLLNVYGPTETTIWSTCAELTDKADPLTIGKPITNTNVYVLDEYHQRVAIGFPGELYIGGQGVTLGYWQNAKLTQERFLTLFNQCVYRTGDKVKWLPNGELMFLGRMDRQIKIRGMRIELAEIEYCLMQHPAIIQCVVLQRGKDSNAYLSAYFISSAPPSTSELNVFLKKYLPQAAIPAKIIHLEHMPHLPNGKIDVNALPSDQDHPEHQTFRPATNSELILIGICSILFPQSTITIRSHFFEIGGNSLIAAQLATRIRRQLNIDLPVKKIFEYPTLEALAGWLDTNSTRISQKESDTAMKQNNLPLSSSQQALWFIHQFEEDRQNLYNLMLPIRLQGQLNISILEKTINTLIQRHDSLRTTFDIIEHHPTQVIHPETPWSLDEEHVNIEQLHSILTDEAAYRFNLTQYPLFRIRLLRLSKEDVVLIWNMPHMIIDGWSFNILQREFIQLYAAYLENKSPTLAPALSYSLYTQWQRTELQDKKLEQLEQFWKDTLTYAPTLNLPTDRPRPPVMRYHGAHVYFKLSPEISSELNQLARDANVTLFVVLFSVFSVLICRYSQENDLTIATVSANREREEFEEIVGLFANTLAIRLQLNTHVSFKTLLQKVLNVYLAALSHQALPFEKVVDLLQIQRDPSRTPLTQVMFVLQNANADYTLELSNIKSAWIQHPTPYAKMDLTLTLHETYEGIDCDFEYSTDLFDVDTVERMATHYQMLIRSVIQNPILEIYQLPIVTPEEHILFDTHWHRLQTTQSVKEKTTLHELFEMQAQRTPHHIALKFGDKCLTYQELNQSANQLALSIRQQYQVYYQQTLPSDTLVGLCVERGFNMIIGILGILKAGGAYVPLDPAYPSERLQHIVKDSDIAMLVTETLMQQGDMLFDPQRIIMVEDTLICNTLNPIAMSSINHANDLAYVIYTSGSTGRPKGTLLTHQNVIRLFESAASIYDFDEHDIWCLFHSFAFDFSVWEIWGALLYGGCLVIVPYNSTRDPSTFFKLLLDEKITVLNQTPSAFNALMPIVRVNPLPLSLRFVIFGGEPLLVNTLQPWFEAYGDKKPLLVNMYGITETTVHVTWRCLSLHDLKQPYCNNIGQPLRDLQIEVLDPLGQRLPIGGIGELYISGPGLARGYIHQPELTARVFHLRNDKRFYKTGDLVRFLKDGSLQYIGRVDKQLKLRGFRIEPQEIESVLLRHHEILEAFIKADQYERLIAYYVSAVPLEDQTLHTLLREYLPDYMLPSIYIHLTQLPLTGNGKIAVNELPLPGRFPELECLVAPRNQVEASLVKIWCDVLVLEQIGIQDNFFACGGDSIRSMEVVSKAKEHNLYFSAKTLFRYPTIAALAPHVKSKDSADESLEQTPFFQINPHDKTHIPPDMVDAYPLSSLQQGMIFHSELGARNATYIDVLGCYVEGKFNAELMKLSFEELIRQHEVLRISFALGLYSEPLQLVHRDVKLPLNIVDIRHLTDSVQSSQIQEWFLREKHIHFVFSTAPLWRITIYQLKDEKIYFALTCHHSILDGWSVALFLTSLFNLYEDKLALEANIENEERHPERSEGASSTQEMSRKLDMTYFFGGAASGITAGRESKPSFQFKDYIAKERASRNDSTMKAFWEKTIGQVSPTLIAQTANFLGTHQLRRESLEISNELAEALSKRALQYECGLDTLFLAVHLYALHWMTGSSNIMTGIATHGRQTSEPVLGLFLNSTPFPIHINEAPWQQFVVDIIKQKDRLSDFNTYPLNQIQKDCNAILFDTLFNFIHFHVFERLRHLKCLQITPDQSYEETNFTLVAQAGIDVYHQRPEYHLVYHADRLSTSTMKFVRELYQHALASIAYDDHAPSIIDLMPRKTETEPTYSQTIPALFLTCVSKTPDAIAISDGELNLSYRELNDQVNRFAHVLQQTYQTHYHAQFPLEALIGLSLSANKNMIIAILAILKLGGAYLPLDKRYPKTKLQDMIEHSCPSIIIVENSEDFVANNRVVIQIETLLHHSTDASCHEPNSIFNTANLAYVMYTSGSTGTPKGVMIEHHSIVRLIHRPNYITIQQGDCIAQAANSNFDAFTFEIWGALLNSATLVLVDERTLLAPEKFSEFIRQKQITILWLTARLLDQYVNAGYADMFHSLRYLLAGGDVLNKESIRQILNCKSGSPTYLLNGYGPTENTTFTTVYPITHASLEYESIPIGFPINDTELWVLSPELKPLPPGFEGQLYISGGGLARGYYQNNDLTTRTFIPNPFRQFDPLEANTLSKLYKTGDRVRQLADGAFVFLGRDDRQIKIRGIRIELDEVESLIAEIPEIKQVYVTVQRNTENIRMLAYCIPNNSITPESLRHQLAQKVPKHMIPTHIIFLENFPLTTNGKIDVERLPTLRNETLDACQGTGPTNEIEANLFSIWRDILLHETFSIDDNFFDIGGDSILVVTLYSKIKLAFQVEISITDIFQHPSIAAFANFLQGHQIKPEKDLKQIQQKRNQYRNQQRIKKRQGSEHV